MLNHFALGQLRILIFPNKIQCPIKYINQLLILTPEMNQNNKSETSASIMVDILEELI